ncbi:MAG: hypothetical protein AB1540_00515 [Bdellovibrionota bacterium]
MKFSTQNLILACATLAIASTVMAGQKPVGFRNMPYKSGHKMYTTLNGDCIEYRVEVLDPETKQLFGKTVDDKICAQKGQTLLEQRFVGDDNRCHVQFLDRDFDEIFARSRVDLKINATRGNKFSMEAQWAQSQVSNIPKEECSGIHIQMDEIEYADMVDQERRLANKEHEAAMAKIAELEAKVKALEGKLQAQDEILARQDLYERVAQLEAGLQGIKAIHTSSTAVAEQPVSGSKNGKRKAAKRARNVAEQKTKKDRASQ